MTLVMDGVRRVRSGQPLPAAIMIPRYDRPAQAMRRMAALQSMESRWASGGLDGVRRMAPAGAAVLPRTVLDNLLQPAAAESVMPAAPATGTLAGPATGLWQRRTIAFGLVAAAMVAAGATAWTLTAHRTATARADSSRAAAQPVASTAPAPKPDPAAAAIAQQQAGLQQLLNQFVAGQAGAQYGIVVKDLKTGAMASIDPARSMTSASLYKLFVANAIYHGVDVGQFTYGQTAADTGRNIDGCLTVMINISDNTCGRGLGSMLGWGKQNADLHAAGYTGTDLTTPQQTNAQDVALLLERLYNGTLNSPSSNDRFLGLLKDQRVNNRLPVGLPAATTIAHKTGDLDGFVHDAGIVYGPKTDYLVVVMSGPWNSPGNAPGQFANLSGQLWHFFEQ